MASKKKTSEETITFKKAEETITFKKGDLIKKLTTFLERNNACDRDWVNKVRVEFLGEQLVEVTADVDVKRTYAIKMACKGTPTKEEVAAAIFREMEESKFTGWEGEDDYDENQEFTVTKVSVEN